MAAGAILKLAVTTDSVCGTDLSIVEVILIPAGMARILPPLLERIVRRSNPPADSSRPNVLSDQQQFQTLAQTTGHDHCRNENLSAS